jgi:hypothetical protein
MVSWLGSQIPATMMTAKTKKMSFFERERRTNEEE